MREVTVHLEPEEISAAVGALPAGDRLKLTLVERGLLRGTGHGRGDLLNEAICRALLGKRNCPRAVPIMAFLIETMRSLASHARDREMRSTHADEQALARVSEKVNAGTFAPREPSPEDRLIEAEDAAGQVTLEDILALFVDDDEAGMVVLGMHKGLKGKALREDVGLDQAALDYAKRRVRKTLLRQYPNWWRT